VEFLGERKEKKELSLAVQPGKEEESDNPNPTPQREESKSSDRRERGEVGKERKGSIPDTQKKKKGKLIPSG